MKMIKMALLGGAALAVTTAGARADDLADLKAQVEALNARVAQMEAAPSVPAGYSLLTVSEADASVVPGNALSSQDAAAYGSKATVIGIMPTADMPAGTTVEWSGYVRASVRYYDMENDGTDADYDVVNRGQLKVVGKTDTAVGEVGARIQLRADSGLRDVKPTWVSNEYWGWWAMTPELTLGGGYTGSLANVGYGYDGACNCYITDNADVAMNPGDAHQLRLSWASGPLSFGIAVEDDSITDAADFNALAGAGEVRYSGDMFNAEVSGYVGDENRWRAGGGVGFALGDIANISGGAQIGDKGDQFFGAGVNGDFWTASVLASFNLSDAVHAEAAYGHTEYDDANYSVDAVLAGIYYEPVDQLTIGLEGEWIDDGSAAGTEIYADLVTVFRF